MIKNIIFDIGNVLAAFTWREFFEELGYAGETVERLADATVRTPAWNEVDRGVLSNEELIEQFTKNDPGMEQEIRSMFRTLHNIVQKLDYAIPWVKSLKEAGYRCYYLSNFSRQAHKDCIEALGFLEDMDGGILSYQDLVIKPDPAIYQLLLERYGLKAQECVFMDDTERNLPPARALGMQTILFRDQEQAVRELEGMGVKI